MLETQVENPGHTVPDGIDQRLLRPIGHLVTHEDPDLVELLPVAV